MTIIRRTAPDVALWALLALPAVIDLPDNSGLGYWSGWAGLGLLAGAVAVRRRWPLAALLVVLALAWAMGNFAPAVPVMAYGTGVRLRRARPVVWLFAGVFCGGFMLSFARGMDSDFDWLLLTVWLVLLGVLPWLLGRYRRQYGELVAAGWERAERLENEQRIIAERERARERARIAEDMHDALGHELSLIALRAGGLELAADLPERHREAVRDLRLNAAEATERLRQITSVLREDGAPLTPSGESVADLVERAAASGLDVALEQHADGEAPLLAERTVHRVVQEALTNAAKHAPGASVTVRIGPDGDGTLAEIVNGPPAAAPDPGRAGGLLGLTSLRERVALTGGSFAAGPTADGGFAVTARIPHAYTGSAPGEPSGAAAQLADRRRLLRRDLRTAVGVPLGLVGIIAVVMAGYYASYTYASVLSRAAYDEIAIGADRDSLDLPARRMPNPPDGARRPGCEVYRSDANPLGYGAVYRVCFDDGRVSAKQILGGNG